MKTAIAMGKIAADGTILKATPGITISTKIDGRYGPGEDGGYTVTLPDRLVNDDNYIVQLTADSYGEDGPDFVLTTIATRFQKISGFEVLIWGSRAQTIGGIHPVRCNWHFVIYDIR